MEEIKISEKKAGLNAVCTIELTLEEVIWLTKSLNSVVTYGLPVLLETGCDQNQKGEFSFLLFFKEQVSNFIIDTALSNNQ